MYREIGENSVAKGRIHLYLWCLPELPICFQVFFLFTSSPFISFLCCLSLCYYRWSNCSEHSLIPLLTMMLNVFHILANDSLYCVLDNVSQINVVISISSLHLCMADCKTCSCLLQVNYFVNPLDSRQCHYFSLLQVLWWAL